MEEVEKKKKGRVQVRQGTEVEMHKMGYCSFGRAEEGSIVIKESRIFCSLSPHVVIVVVVELDIVTEC